MYIYSESCPPISKTIKILWFDTFSLEELFSLITKSISAFWGDGILISGIYLKPYIPFLKRSRTFSIEYAEAIIPKLEIFEKSRDCHICGELVTKSQRGLLSLHMPPWDYYQYFDSSIKIDDLLREYGFYRIK